MDVTRHFAKRETEKSAWSGEIGRVTLSANIAEVKIDGKPLPEASVQYLLNFALQSLQDAYAGAKNLSEAQGAFNTKYDRLIAGTISERGSGDSETEEEFCQRKVTRDRIKLQLSAKYGKKSKELTDFLEMEGDALRDYLDAKYAANTAALQNEVTALIAERKAARAAKAKALAQNIVLDL